MAIPNGGDTPSKYRPNPADDRAVTGRAGTAYFAVAVALDAITEDITPDVLKALDPGTRKALRTAESALRRAGFSLVVHA